MWNALAWTTLEDAEIATEVDALRESTLKSLLWATALGYLAWHLASTSDATPEALMRHWILVPVVVLGLVTTWLLYCRRSRMASWWFLFSSGLSITVGTWLFAAPAGTMLFPLLALVAVVLLNPLAGISVSLGYVAVLVALQDLGPLAFLTEDQLIVVAVVSGVTVGVAWVLGRNMVIAVEWSLNSYSRAAKSAHEARRHRAELVKALKQLDTAYYQLERANAALVLAWKAAEVAERSKSEFVTNISHELRTPLNLIVGFSETILTSPESYQVPLPAPYRGDLNAVYRSAQHLLTLTNDVIDMARIGMERLALAREPLDLGQIVTDACTIVREYLATKGLYLQIEIQPDLPRLELDRLRVRQVVLNLLTNAARFTERGGITVTVKIEGDWIIVKVIDTGRGIAPGDLERVFDDFYHVEHENDRQESIGGYGLGLPISKRLIELHGGQIGVESTLGVGTTFWFALPLTSAETGHVVSGQQPRSVRLTGVSRPSERILVLAGSDEPFAQFLQSHLRATRVVAKGDLAGAAAAAVELRAAAIVADPSMIGRDDIESLPVPTCAVSLPCRKRLAASLGVAAYLVKPVTRADLRKVMRQVGQSAQTILIVDDDPRFVRLLTRLVSGIASRPRGRILTAHNGIEALEIMDTACPDLVLLDLVMPNMGGLEVVRAMARSPRLARVPVVIISAQDQYEGPFALEGALSIQKPGGFRLEELMRAIEAILGVLEPPDRYLTAGPRAAAVDAIGRQTLDAAKASEASGH